MLRPDLKKIDFEKFEQEKSMITSPKINDKIELFNFIRDTYKISLENRPKREMNNILTETLSVANRLSMLAYGHPLRYYFNFSLETGRATYFGDSGKVVSFGNFEEKSIQLF